ncbi:alcohol acetyltransferase/n-acetyltransferase [Desulfoluna spongiiphila]|nr:alcohol acetyltransferase/n-acetyltransferase [Desulfoluna spongiiphila]
MSLLDTPVQSREKMKRQDADKSWYRLDNAGKLFPSITSTRISTVFRVSATLVAPVDKSLLQDALDAVIPRFPYFQVTLKRGLFWYYFERSHEQPRVEEEIFYPCMFLMYKKRGVFPFRVLYFNRRISLEISHSVTDGTGALEFLKSLIAEYARIAGVSFARDDTICHAGDEPDPEEFEDSFRAYYQKNIPQPHQVSRAYLFPFELLPKGEYSIVTGIMKTEEILEVSKRHGATVTHYFTALYFDAVQQYLKVSGEKNPSPVVLNVPVNLRRLFPSRTMRNFFVSITPSLDFRLGHFSFEEILAQVKHAMGMMATTQYLRQLICRNVKPEMPLMVRLMPLYVKKLVTRLIFREFGEKNNTSSISNLGNIILPDGLAPFVERFEFYPPPGKQNVVKIGIVSYAGKVYVTFGSLTEDKIIERYFFRKIRKMGIRVKIETNALV